MRLRPFFRYFGSKHRLAPKYPAPKHGLIIETHAGSAAYSTLYHGRSVLLVERDPDIFCLWRWLIRASESDVRALPTALTQGQDIRELDIPYPAQVLIRLWQRVGANRCWTVSKWNGANTGLWHPQTRDAIAGQLRHIRHWHVVRGDSLSIDWTPVGPATWFIDPPYQSQQNVYGGVRPDFVALAEFARTRHGQVIVCEAPGADWLPFRPLGLNTVGRTAQGGTRAKRLELVWLDTA